MPSLATPSPPWPPCVGYRAMDTPDWLGFGMRVAGGRDASRRTSTAAHSKLLSAIMYIRIVHVPAAAHTSPHPTSPRMRQAEGGALDSTPLRHALHMHLKGQWSRHGGQRGLTARVRHHEGPSCSMGAKARCEA